MTGRYKAPRGTQDILPEDQPHWDFVREVAARISKAFGYEAIKTPVFEEASLFTRGVKVSSNFARMCEMPNSPCTNGVTPPRRQL